MQKIQENTSTGSTRGAGKARLNWLFLDLNSYFASVEQNENPTLIGRPIAVVPMDTDYTCAIAASYEAKAYGVKTGTMIKDAKELCPDLVCVVARHHKYVEYHHAIMAEIEQHIPITRKCSIDEVACELLENEQSIEYIHDLAARLKTGIRKNVGRAIGCSIGVAQNPFLAKLASDMQKPDGLTILPPDNFTDKLFQLKLRDLTGIGRNIEIRLNNAGINTVEQLYNLSPKHVRKAWGSVQGEKFWLKMHGVEVPEIETKTSVVGHSRILEPALRFPPKAYGVARHLTVKASSRLRTGGHYARKFSLSVRTPDKKRWEHTRSFSPTQDNFVFVKALEAMWNMMLSDIQPYKLFKISIVISDLYEKAQVTLDLFDSTAEETEQNNALTECMDALNQRYGTDTISIGAIPECKSSDLGTKIAFTRIPELEEFES
ncbi:MAG: impB/mucB/samB family protein [Zetaproteobacteria bacterium]|nr:MAG: impB/mucB/samB family protein [Zetaproteobacteria bacterium]